LAIFHDSGVDRAMRPVSRWYLSLVVYSYFSETWNDFDLRTGVMAQRLIDQRGLLRKEPSVGVRMENEQLTLPYVMYSYLAFQAALEVGWWFCLYL